MIVLECVCMCVLGICVCVHCVHVYMGGWLEDKVFVYNMFITG